MQTGIDVPHGRAVEKNKQTYKSNSSLWLYAFIRKNHDLTVEEKMTIATNQYEASGSREGSSTSTVADNHANTLDDKYNGNMQQSLEKENEQKDDLEKESGKDSTADQQADPEYPGLLKAVLIVVSLFITVFLVALDQTIIGTAIPKITDQFHSVQDVGWYGSAYFLTSTALQPTYGRIYKILNVRWIPVCLLKYHLYSQ